MKTSIMNKFKKWYAVICLEGARNLQNIDTYVRILKSLYDENGFEYKNNISEKESHIMISFDYEDDCITIFGYINQNDKCVFSSGLHIHTKKECVHEVEDKLKIMIKTLNDIVKTLI